MKQEHRLVAEIYRFIAPFIDTTKEIYLSLDGQAAKTAVGTGRFTDPDIPDLWFTLVGSAQPVRIEAKILDKGAALLMQSQILAWRTAGVGAYKPVSWIAANREFNQFYYWDHSSFTQPLDRCSASRKTHTLAAPRERVVFAAIPPMRPGPASRCDAITEAGYTCAVYRGAGCGKLAAKGGVHIRTLLVARDVGPSPRTRLMHGQTPLIF